MKHFTCFAGLGDHTLWLGLLPHVPGEKTVTCDPRMEPLVRLYEGRSYDHLIVTPNQPPGGFLCWHGAHVGDERAYIGARDATMADVVREILGVPKDAEVMPPVWPKRPMQLHPLADWPPAEGSAARILVDAHLPITGTVLLAPWAHTAQVHLPIYWWMNAAAWLRDQGWTVATNVCNRGRGYDQSRQGPILEAIPGTVPVNVPLDEIGPFAELCGAVLMARSGLADVLARCRARMCVVWPWNPARDMPSEKERAIWSVARMYGADVAERVVDRGAAFDPGQLEGWPCP